MIYKNFWFDAFTDLMNVTEEVAIHRPSVSTPLSSAFIRGDLNSASRGLFISSLISCLFSEEVLNLNYKNLLRIVFAFPVSPKF